MTTVPSSPPPSPQEPMLQLPGLSRIILWSVRRRAKAAASASDEPGANGPPESPRPQKRAKPHHIECSSGAELKTHGRIVDSQPECRKSDVIVQQEVFVCVDGVDTIRLLLLSRRSVIEKVLLMGGNTLIDERWTCTICKHHTRQGDIFRVSITYQGTPARCSLPDPQIPVATDEAKGVPGLMTIVSRQ